jgi:hypothetical protein
VPDLETFMVGQPPGRTFISYSRKDGAEFAAWLRGWLDERRLSTRQDIVALEGGRDWWSQIEDALKSKRYSISLSSLPSFQCAPDH